MLNPNIFSVILFSVFAPKSHLYFLRNTFLLFPPSLWGWIFQQVRLLCNLFQPLLFFLGQLFQIQFEPLTDKHQSCLLRVAVWTGGFLGGLQKIFQRIVLRDAEKIVLVCLINRKL